jgi:hypothetical protein
LCDGSNDSVSQIAAELIAARLVNADEYPKLLELLSISLGPVLAAPHVFSAESLQHLHSGE